jgi:hypothetical protein
MWLEYKPSSGITTIVPLLNEQTKVIIQRSQHLATTTSLCDGDEELGRISTCIGISPYLMLICIALSSGTTKLEAVKRLHVFPGHSSAEDQPMLDPRIEAYKLEPASEGRHEILILRHGDVIRSSGVEDTLRYVHQVSEVQINSSAAEFGQAAESEAKYDAKDSPEAETEDEAISDNTVTEVPRTQPVTQQNKTQPSATPQFTTHQSIVQETPTTERMMAPQAVMVLNETFSTARTGQSQKSNVQDSLQDADGKRPHGSPEVRIDRRSTRKRPSDDSAPTSESVPSTESRSVKRLKSDNSVNDEENAIDLASPLDQFNTNPTRTTYSARIKNRSKAAEEEIPTKPLRSSQRSGTSAAYEGDPPRVATSNSALNNTSAAVKFLKKHGGTLLSSVEDKCNVLWYVKLAFPVTDSVIDYCILTMRSVRDGGLVKTMKVFQAIALGVPIVTDKWLTDSAKSDEFLDLTAYKPSIAQQEKDWKFKLENVWGAAQTPFKGYSIYFTPSLKKTYTSFREIDRVCQTVGAKVVAKHTSKNEKMIVLATEEEDPDAEKMIQDGETCYRKDLLTTSILRGTLDLDSDEFKIKQQNAEVPRKRASRKST